MQSDRETGSILTLQGSMIRPDSLVTVYFHCVQKEKLTATVDTLGIEPSTPRMLSGCDNQLHHVPMHLA